LQQFHWLILPLFFHIRLHSSVFLKYYFFKDEAITINIKKVV